MDEKDIILFGSVISELTILRHRIVDKFKIKNKFGVGQLSFNQTNQIQEFRTTTTDFPLSFLNIQERSIKQNGLTSCDLNIFKIFGVGETMHSYLLANLLNPYGEHGQKHLFLNIFLDQLKIKRFSDSENWIVTAEKGRIDILLKRVQPHSVIVIENKSNYATDQENQLYRYWHQEIYKTICNRHLPDYYITKPPDNFYQLIYLSPAHWKIPSNNSLIKPTYWDKDLPKEVPLKTKYLLFSDFIVQWLNMSLEQLSKENHRVREHIKQYLELWS
jgi:hypothetical protein